MWTVPKAAWRHSNRMGFNGGMLHLAVMTTRRWVGTPLVPGRRYGVPLAGGMFLARGNTEILADQRFIPFVPAFPLFRRGTGRLAGVARIGRTAERSPSLARVERSQGEPGEQGNNYLNELLL